MSRAVWRLFTVYHMPPSRIDRMLGLPVGESRRMVVREWKRMED